MKAATTKISDCFLKELLLIPDNWEITGITFDRATGTATFHLFGENIPAEPFGKIQAMLTKHDGGVSAKWVPVPPPGPSRLPSRLLRKSGTDICFWCNRPAYEHDLPELECPVHPV